MSLIGRLLKANPSAQVSDMLTGYFVIPSAKSAFDSQLSSRGIFAGGLAATKSNVIDYINIKTLGNATDFGDLTLARRDLSACSNSTRGLFGGGSTISPTIAYNIIDYITIASTGNATDFGDLTIAEYQLCACSNSNGGV